MDKTLSQMTEEVRKVNTEKGWRTGKNTFGDYIALLHSEVSEALEAYRDYRLEDNTRTYDHPFRNDGGGCCLVCEDPHDLPKPEGVGSEFADMLIRILDVCDIFKVNLAFEYERKMAFNRTRPYQHGGRTLGE